MVFTTILLPDTMGATNIIGPKDMIFKGKLK
jgi:hypothetical protein